MHNILSENIFRIHKFNLYLRVNSFLFLRDTTVFRLEYPSNRTIDLKLTSGRSIYPCREKHRGKRLVFIGSKSRQLHIATRISRALRAQLVDHEVRFIAALLSLLYASNKNNITRLFKKRIVRSIKQFLSFFF